jgi:diaminopimelate decarboxylase
MSLFLTDTQLKYIKEHYTLPTYVYSEEELEKCAEAMLQFPSAFGHTVRFAMKANSNKNILKFFSMKGIQIDASSYYEVKRALLA